MKKYIVRRHDNLFLLDIDETGQPIWTEDIQKAFVLSERDVLYKKMKDYVIATMDKKEEIFSFVEINITLEKK